MPPKDHLYRDDTQAAWIEAYTEKLSQSIPASWPENGFPFVQDQRSMRDFVQDIRSSMYRYEKEKSAYIVPVTAEIEVLLAEIEEVFGDVTDEGAPNLALSGEALDGPYFPEMLRILSRNEIRGDWRDIPHCLLFACDCCLSFVDAPAYRFLLPAYMCFSLKNYFSPDMVATLAASEELLAFQLDKFGLFNAKQREAVTHFMNWHRRCDCCDLDLDFLLPWELEAYLAQGEHSSPQEWLWAEYDELLA